MVRVLLVEDSQDVCRLVEANWDDLGCRAQLSIANDGRQGLEQALEEEFSLIILDVVLPEISGFEICEKIRSEGVKTPILFLTGNTSQADKYKGFSLGADDYLTKPFEVIELFARTRAILRRAGVDLLDDAGQQEPSEQIITHADLTINIDQRKVYRGSQLLHLTKSEYNLLNYFLKSPGRTFSTKQISATVFDDDDSVYEQNIATHISRLRQRIEPQPASPRYILTNRGFGYYLATEDDIKNQEQNA